MNFAIILAGGQGERSGRKEGKLLAEVAGKPVIYYTLMSLNDHDKVDEIVLVVSKKNKGKIEEVVAEYNFRKVKTVVLGGESRAQSLKNGVKELKKRKIKKDDIVIVQNGANPLPSYQEVEEVIQKAKEKGAGLSGHFSKSTVKEVLGQSIKKTHDRKKIFLAETPQASNFEVLEKGVGLSKNTKKEITDEAMLYELAGAEIGFVEADDDNFKITTQADIQRLKAVLGETPNEFLVGVGQDSHMFEEKKKGLMLGGVKIESEYKLKANSDGDVILHALFNAFSQAIGDMSLGFYADEMCEKGIKDSSKYLEKILEKIKKKDLHINSVGIMIECKTPKIDPLNAKIKKSLAGILEIKSSKIGITATSGEGLTPFGQGVGIQCFAIISLKKV